MVNGLHAGKQLLDKDGNAVRVVEWHESGVKVQDGSLNDPKDEVIRVTYRMSSKVHEVSLRGGNRRDHDVRGPRDDKHYFKYEVESIGTFGDRTESFFTGVNELPAKLTACLRKHQIKKQRITSGWFSRRLRKHQIQKQRITSGWFDAVSRRLQLRRPRFVHGGDRAGN